MKNTIKNTTIVAFVLVFSFSGLFNSAFAASNGNATFWNGEELVPIYWDGSSTGNNGNGNNGGNNNGDDQVVTLSATNVDEDSARLRGEVTNGNNVDVWFVIDDNDSTPSCSDDDIQYNVSGDYDDGDQFSRTISGLDSDETYYFRACTDEDSGSVRSFTTDDDNGNNNNNDDDDNYNYNGNNDVVAITSVATDVTTSSAILNGLSIISDGGSGNAWFEYGLTTALGQRTPNQSVSEGSNNVSRQILNLSPRTPYFFRMVVQNSEGTDAGEIKVFTTGGFSTNTNAGNNSGNNGNSNNGGNTTTVVTTNDKVFLGLDITSNLEIVSVGDIVTYTISYNNISGNDLKNVIMQVTLPYEVAFQKSTLGGYSKPTHTVTVTVENLPKGAKGSFVVVGEVLKSARGSSIIIASLLGIHDHPTIEDAKVDSMSYSIIEVNKGGTNQSANSVFAGKFFPTSFIGWLLIVLIILIIILIARKIVKDKEEREEEKNKEEGIKIAK